MAGCGYVGTALGELLAARGHEVFGLRRRPGGLPASIRPLAADLTRPETLRAIPSAIDVVFYTAAAGAGSDDAYRAAYVDGLRNLVEAFAARAVRRIFFTSSTAVYAQAAGEWVDESSRAEPAHFSGRRLLEAERALATSGLPFVVLRLGGVYGPGRTRLVDSVRSGRARFRSAAPIYTNRIHRDDCARALAHLASLTNPAPLYIGVDHEPAREEDVLRWLAARLGAPAPREAAAPCETSDALSRRGRSSKRCCSARLVASGHRFRYPTFREGYESVLRAMGLVLAMSLVCLAPPARARAAASPRGTTAAAGECAGAPQGAADPAAGRRCAPDSTGVCLPPVTRSLE